jgi:hypothetical protein
MNIAFFIVWFINFGMILTLVHLLKILINLLMRNLLCSSEMKYDALQSVYSSPFANDLLKE